MNKFKTRQEMAHEMGISYPTFYRKCKSLGIRLGKGLLCPLQQQEIRQSFGAWEVQESPPMAWSEDQGKHLKGFDRL